MYIYVLVIVKESYCALVTCHSSLM